MTLLIGIERIEATAAQSKATTENDTLGSDLAKLKHADLVTMAVEKGIAYTGTPTKAWLIEQIKAKLAVSAEE
jgi:hypothetical protein